MLAVMVIARFPAHSVRWVRTPVKTPSTVATTLHGKTAPTC